MNRVCDRNADNVCERDLVPVVDADWVSVAIPDTDLVSDRANVSIRVRESVAVPACDEELVADASPVGETVEDDERQWEREELSVGVVVLLMVSDEDCVSERAAETKSFVSVLDGSHVNDHETDVHLDMLLLSVVVPVTLGDAVEALESVAVEYTVGVLEPLAV